jgi:hypothetical protein
LAKSRSAVKEGHFTGEGRKLSYCSDQAQRAYAAQRRTNTRPRTDESMTETKTRYRLPGAG